MKKFKQNNNILFFMTRMLPRWVSHLTRLTSLTVVIHVCVISAGASPVLKALKGRPSGHGNGFKLYRASDGNAEYIRFSPSERIFAGGRRKRSFHGGQLDSFTGTVHARAIPMSGALYGRKRRSGSMPLVGENEDVFQNHEEEEGEEVPSYSDLLENYETIPIDYDESNRFEEVAEPEDFLQTPGDYDHDQSTYSKRVPYSGSVYGRRRRRKRGNLNSAGKRSTVPFSGNLYGRKRSTVPFSGNLYGRKRSTVPFSGNLYGRKRSTVPFSGNLYGRKRSTVPFSGNLYGRKRSTVPFSGNLYGRKRSTVPFSGNLYGRKRSTVPFSGNLYGRKRSTVPFSGNLYGRKRSVVPFSGNLYGRKRSLVPFEEKNYHRKRNNLPLNDDVYEKRVRGYVPYSGPVYGKRTYYSI